MINSDLKNHWFWHNFCGFRICFFFKILHRRLLKNVSQTLNCTSENAWKSKVWPNFKRFYNFLKALFTANYQIIFEYWKIRKNCILVVYPRSIKIKFSEMFSQIYFNLKFVLHGNSRFKNLFLKPRFQVSVFEVFQQRSKIPMFKSGNQLK